MALFTPMSVCRTWGLPFPPQKRKGLQLALEPLNSLGIAGYVPKP